MVMPERSCKYSETTVDLKKIKPFTESGAHFKFTVKFFPECMQYELVQDVVKTFFFKHEIERLLNDENVDIPPDTRTLYSAVYVNFSRFTLLVSSPAPRAPGCATRRLLKQKF
ncbi:LOW QUALITY PROTEIN: hypothetical protein MXB_2816 [Myxobolus squamalis]|nr:LOW QUALITY PROTEIN: hypothetical protein MXB_2816 [Myxobolus squamalis]